MAEPRIILVTGAGGQLGRALLRESPPAGTVVRGLSRSELDITDAGAVRRAIETVRPAVVINAAAFTAVDRAEAESDAAFAINAGGARTVAEAAARAGCGMIQLSTDYVFDGREATPYEEQDATAPLNVYGASKRAAEEAVLAIAPRALVVRTSWLIGAEGRNFATTVLARADRGEPMSVVSDQRGSPTGVGDLAAALVGLAGRMIEDPAPPHGIYHFANAGEASWHELAVELLGAHRAAGGLAEPEVTAIATADRPGAATRPAYSTLSSAAIARDHGIVARDWREMVAEVVARRMREARP